MKKLNNRCHIKELLFVSALLFGAENAFANEKDELTIGVSSDTQENSESQQDTVDCSKPPACPGCGWNGIDVSFYDPEIHGTNNNNYDRWVLREMAVSGENPVCYRNSYVRSLIYNVVEPPTGNSYNWFHGKGVNPLVKGSISMNLFEDLIAEGVKRDQKRAVVYAFLKILRYGDEGHEHVLEMIAKSIVYNTDSPLAWIGGFKGDYLLNKPPRKLRGQKNHNKETYRDNLISRIERVMS